MVSGPPKKAYNDVKECDSRTSISTIKQEINNNLFLNAEKISSSICNFENSLDKISCVYPQRILSQLILGHTIPIWKLLLTPPLFSPSRSYLLIRDWCVEQKAIHLTLF